MLPLPLTTSCLIRKFTLKDVCGEENTKCWLFNVLGLQVCGPFEKEFRSLATLYTVTFMLIYTRVRVVFSDAD